MSQQYRMDIPKEELQGVLDDLKLEPQFKIISQDDRDGIVVLIVEDTSAPDPVVAPDPGPATPTTSTAGPMSSPTAPESGAGAPGPGAEPSSSGAVTPGSSTGTPASEAAPSGSTTGTATAIPATNTTGSGADAAIATGKTTPGTATPPTVPLSSGGLRAASGKNQAVVNALIAGANTHGLDPITVLTIIAIESMYNPTICNKFSSAAGLFQFIDSTWKKESGGMAFPGRGGNGRGQAAGASVSRQVEIGCRFTKANAVSLKAQLGSEPDATRIYMAHQQGLGGALAILRAAQRNPNAPITSVISPDAAKLNGFGGLTVGQTVAKFAALVQKKVAVAKGQVAS